MKEELKQLIGCKVTKVEEFNNSAFNRGFLIFFDNGLILTAQDGEYGDNAFKFKLDYQIKDYTLI